MKIYMRIIANAELDIDEISGATSDVAVKSTEIYSSENGIDWIKMEGSELDQFMSENVKKVIGL